MGAAADRLYRQIPYLYLVWAVPLILILAWVVPPWQNPDEAEHMLRTAQIAHGGLVGQRINGSAGGTSDAGIAQASQPLASLYGHYEQKADAASIAAANAPVWGQLQYLPYPHTAVYPVFFYLPAALCVAVGEELGLHVSATLRVARIVNGLCAVLMGALALGLAQSTRVPLAALLTLPMTISLCAAVNQDGLSIPLMCLCVAVVEYLVRRNRTLTPVELGFFAAALTMIIMARPPYLPIALLPLLPAGRAWKPAAICAGAVAAISCLWIAYVVGAVSVPADGGDASAQISFLLHNPLRIGAIALTTIRADFPEYGRQLIGTLGYLDVWLPLPYLCCAAIVLLLAFLGGGACELRRAWLLVVVVVAAAAGIFAAQYLTFTKPGAPDVAGVQGRYFLPLLAIAALLTPTVPRIGPSLRRVALLSVVALAVVTPAVMIRALVVRYYLYP